MGNNGNLLNDAAMRAVIENTEDFVFIKDKNFVYTASSKSFAVDAVGVMNAKDIIGKTDFEIFRDRKIAENTVLMMKESLKTEPSKQNLGKSILKKMVKEDIALPQNT